MLKRLTITIVFMAIIGSVMADYADGKAKSVRKMRAKKTILCGPKADKAAKVVALADALKSLKPGSALKLQSGDYGKELIEINNDKIIIEGANPEEICNLNLLLTSKSATVRNIYLKSLIAPNNVIIVDSRFNGLTLRGDRKKVEQVVCNCCMNTLFIGPALKKVFIKNVTVAHGDMGLELGDMRNPKSGKMTPGELFIGDSIITGNESACYLEVSGFRKLECTFSNCIFKGGKALFYAGVLKKECTKLKKLTNYMGKYKQKGKVLIVDPKFETPDGFALSKDSKGFKKKWGVKVNDKMVPVP